MSLIQIEGDLLDFPNGMTVIAHSCNCQNKMGAGIAKQIKERFPQAFKADTIAATEGLNTLGNFSYAQVNSNPVQYVYNLYNQLAVGRERRQVNYEAFYTGLRNLKNEIINLQAGSGRSVRVGFPFKMSCNNAGGSWPIIETMLYDVFRDREVDSYIVYNPIYD